MPSLQNEAERLSKLRTLSSEVQIDERVKNDPNTRKVLVKVEEGAYAVDYSPFDVYIMYNMNLQPRHVIDELIRLDYFNQELITYALAYFLNKYQFAVRGVFGDVEITTYDPNTKMYRLGTRAFKVFQSKDPISIGEPRSLESLKSPSANKWAQAFMRVLFPIRNSQAKSRNPEAVTALI